jgi:hypothetical protein
MKENTNPLDNIRIASPCGADWGKMYGSERKRFCAECKLNVYNISEMTREEAENLIIRSEGRLCLRIFRRMDGTVLTQNCPVGWARVKRRLSRMRTAVFGIVGGFVAGVFGMAGMRALGEFTDQKEVPERFYESTGGFDRGQVSNLPEAKSEISRDRKTNGTRGAVVGRVEKIATMEQSIHMDPFRTP